ncbi:MAG: hypothetical protein GY785_24885 [Gammaproteobacteria bacterium]|nr:hypothetical protein [Gammaproteobacteria bacterium]
MNNCMHKPSKLMTLTGFLLICAAIVSACGGGSSQSAGIGGTGITTARGYVQGKVTGFGSFFVDGDKFNTDRSNFLVDGNGGATQSNLAIGMIVTLEVEISDGVYTGNAFEVVYDDELQGPVEATPVPSSDGTQKTFDIFGQTITIDENETEFEGTSFAGLDKDDIVEISGYRSSPTEIIASYVQWKEVLDIDSEVELRGIVENYSPQVKEFTINGFTVTFDDDTDIEVSGGVLAKDMYVEVEGRYKAGPSVHAGEIEEEDEDLGDDLDEVSLQGPISNFMGIDDFKINGQRVDASQANLSPANVEALLDDGVEVDVEGDIVGSVLMADELELEEVETSLKAFVTLVPDSVRFEVSFAGLGPVEIVTNSETEFNDNSPLASPSFSVAEMIQTDFVAVEGIELNGKVIAGSVERLNSAEPDDSQLQGQVDAFATDASVTVLGVPFGVKPSTIYEDSTGVISAAMFFGKIAIGDRVEIKDEKPENGVAERVKLDD